MAKETLGPNGLHPYYWVKTQILSAPDSFDNLSEFLKSGVKFASSKPPYCVQLEGTFSKLALSTDGLTGTNIGGQPNTWLRTVNVFLGSELIAVAKAVEKNTTIYTNSYGTILGESNSIALIANQLLACSPHYQLSNDQWAVQLVRPTLFDSEYILDAQLKRNLQTSPNMAEVVKQRLIDYLS